MASGLWPLASGLWPLASGLWPLAKIIALFIIHVLVLFTDLSR